MEKIEIDGDVFAFLRSKVRNFNETPNSVLRRELGLDKTPVAVESRSSPSLLVLIPKSAPAALEQIMEVVQLVRVQGMDRVSATLRVAERLKVARETVGDKYGRQMDLSTQEFDALLREKDLGRLRAKLIQKFPRYEGVIVEAIKAVAVSTPR
jgi:hypothetical protein